MRPMDSNSLPIVAALKQRMRWLTARQNVIAENVANADTPGYRPRRLKEQSFKDLLTNQTAMTGGGGASLKRTSGQHMRIGGGDMDRSPRQFKAREVADERPNGNGVTLEDELVSMAETQIEYQTMLNVYRKHHAILRTALGRQK